MINAMSFIGEHTLYPVVSGENKPRLHLDGAASPLASSTALETVNALLPHYSNSHSYVHSSAQISTHAFTWAHDTILDCVNAKKRDYTAIFIGSGTTAASNRLARGLNHARADKDIIMISSMEHHANDLPHRAHGKTIIHLPLKPSNNEDEQFALGAIDLEQFKQLCETHSHNINYIAISSVSNVTGISNPIKELTKIAHQHGAYVIIDAAQSVAHMQSTVSDDDIDFMIFSGHKIYTPMAPGVLIAKRELLNTLDEQDLGGGSVSDVSFHDYNLHEHYPDKEQSGTPNLVGATALASVFKQLHRIGLKEIHDHSTTLTKQLIKGLLKLDGMRVYGDLALPRTGAVSFNIKDIDHGLLAAILNDYFAIAVRNDCFCAHPYVSTLLKQELWSLDLDDIPEIEQETYINRKRGMVRASVSLYTDKSDIKRLLVALKTIIENIKVYQPNYKAQADGSYQHKTFTLDWRAQINLS